MGGFVRERAGVQVVGGARGGGTRWRVSLATNVTISGDGQRAGVAYAVMTGFSAQEGLSQARDGVAGAMSAAISGRRLLAAVIVGRSGWRCWTNDWAPGAGCMWKGVAPSACRSSGGGGRGRVQLNSCVR